jgi:hypothetical protein
VIATSNDKPTAATNLDLFGGGRGEGSLVLELLKFKLSTFSSFRIRSFVMMEE